MKKHILLISNLIIIFSIVAGFTGVVYKDTQAYQDLAEKHLENIVNLADINITKQIENSMSKPVMVSKTMANDEFLKSWLSQEPNHIEHETYLEELYSYLKAYQAKYDYTTVFCISAQTGNYYYQGGKNKTLSSEDEHDIWYYNFIKSGNEYDLQVDTNEANNNNITIFVNFRVDGNDGNLLGVIGVGLKVSFIEDMIRSYEQDYGLSVYIINAGGVKNSFSGSTDFFISQEELPQHVGINQTIELNQTESSKLQWFTTSGERKCLITKYDNTLRWYLILEMETNSISSSFQERIKSNVIYMLISLVACILVTSAVFMNYNQRIITIENIDELTGLSNRKLFLQKYLSFVRKHRDQKKTLFLLDIDNFKTINDTYGHVYGNTVLAMVGAELKRAINGHGVASRWGGDEFLGILSGDTEDALRMINQFMNTLKEAKNNDHCCITVSVGVIEYTEKLDMDHLIKKVDEAMYTSKECGRDQITVCR